MNALMLLGAEDMQGKHPWWQPLVASLGGGVLGAVLWRKHWLLATLLGTAAGRNIYGVYVKERDWKDGVRNMGQHLTATAGALALPTHPLVGYLAGAVAGEVLIDGKGNGLLEQWGRALKQDVTTTSTALVPVKEQG